MTTTTALSPWEDRKIQGQHRDRFAVVYVRQSTLQQMVRHQESTRLQYGLVERALAFGWARSQVLVIDEDLGKSGTTAEGVPVAGVQKTTIRTFAVNGEEENKGIHPRIS